MKVACLILIDRDGLVFVTRRGEGKRLAGKWEFPGGKVEDGEGAEAALRREIWEEIGTELGDLEPLGSWEYAYDFGGIELIPFLGRCDVRPEMMLVDHSEARWVGAEALGALDWAPADVPVAAAVVDRLRTEARDSR